MDEPGPKPIFMARKSATPSNLFAAALEVRDFAERLPGRVNRTRAR